MIEAAEVSLIYEDGTQALKKFDLHIGTGEMVYIVGPSGSGKTSFLKLLMGMVYPTTGSLKVMGQPITKGCSREIRQLRKGIGPVFQEFKLLRGRTALDNVLLGMRFLDYSRGQLRENAFEALKRVGLEHKADSLVDHLSQGEQQRVAIARAVARRPRLILADEPTGNLDQDNAIKIMELFASFKDDNTTVIVSTHATHLLVGRNNNILHIDKGSMKWER